MASKMKWISSCFALSLLMGCGDAEIGDMANGLEEVGNRERPSDHFNRNQVYSNTDDFNHHSHMNSSVPGYPTRSYENPEEGLTAQRISDEINELPNVDAVRVVKDKDQLIVALDTESTDKEQMEEQILRIVRQFEHQGPVRIVTNADDFANTPDENERYNKGS